MNHSLSFHCYHKNILSVYPTPKAWAMFNSTHLGTCIRLCNALWLLSWSFIFKLDTVGLINWHQCYVMNTPYFYETTGWIADYVSFIDTARAFTVAENWASTHYSLSCKKPYRNIPLTHGSAKLGVSNIAKHHIWNWKALLPSHWKNLKEAGQGWTQIVEVFWYICPLVNKTLYLHLNICRQETSMMSQCLQNQRYNDPVSKLETQDDKGTNQYEPLRFITLFKMVLEIKKCSAGMV